MKKHTFIALSIALPFASQSADELSTNPNLALSPDYKQDLVLSYDFEDKSQLNDWHAEGLGTMRVEKGGLVLEPDYHQKMLKLHRQGKVGHENEASKFGPYLAEMVRRDHPTLASKMYVKDVFRGGHVNYWNKHQTPENYAISFDFKTLSPLPLHMVMFSALGLKGEDVVSGGLAPRVGLAKEIMHGDLHQYRISYYFPYRKTANMRKAPGRHMTTSGQDIASLTNKNKTQRMTVTKWKGDINYFVDGQHVLQYEDPSPFAGGNWGFRVMVLGKGLYDDISIYKLHSNPIVNIDKNNKIAHLTH